MIHRSSKSKGNVTGNVNGNIGNGNRTSATAATTTTATTTTSESENRANTAGRRRPLSNTESQAQYLYEARGEPALALNAYNELNSGDDSSLSRRHNIALLAYLADTRQSTEQDYLSTLKQLYTKKGEPSLHQHVLAYNLALDSFFNNDFDQAENFILTLYQNFSDIKGDDLRYIRYGDIKCKIAFLLIDCILAVFEVDIVHNILDWVETYINTRANSAVDDSNDGSSFTKESVTELKFRWHCYKARYLFLDAKLDQTKFDANTRAARKELKNAMEIYHHKLSAKKGNSDSIEDSASVQDSVAPSIESTGMSNDNNHDGAVISNGITHGISASYAYDTRTPFESKRSDAQNQHALYLKANLEYLKDHTTKSLKLCSEVHNIIDREKDRNLGSASSSSSREDMTDVQYAIYNNNVALVHHAAGQVFLAMHYYSHAMSYLDRAEKQSDCIKVGGFNIDRDGTMRQISVTQVLYNAAICAKQSGNYLSACECMSRYIALSSEVDARHPFPWLHLGESCIGKFIPCVKAKSIHALGKVN